MAANDYFLSPEAMLRISEYITSLPTPRPQGFANGREMRKLFFDIARRQAELLVAQGDVANLDDGDLMMITAEAIPDAVRPSASGATSRHSGYA